MRKVVGDSRLIYKCCKLYYEKDLSQQEIADKLGLSRVSVSRMIAAGKETGIVRIQVVSPNNLTYSSLEHKLEEKFGLKEAVVVENSPLGTSYDHQTELGTEAIHLLETYIHEGDIVGVSMGETLKSICLAPREETTPLGCTFVSLVGGIHVKESYEDIHSNRIVHQLADKFGGEFIEFFAPALFSNKEVWEGFKKEVLIQSIFKYYNKLDTIIVGVGYTPRVGATMQRAGYMTQPQLEQWIENGAVGDVSLQLFDKDGNMEPFKEHNDRVAGMKLSDMVNVKNKIAICSGKQKAEAVMGAIKGGYINILVTDQECANALLAD